MNQWLITQANEFLHSYGYWTVLFGVMLESAGLPLPGETFIVLASVLAKTDHTLNIVYIGILAASGAIIGDNMGYLVGRKGGRKLLRRYRKFLHISEEPIHKGESLFKRRGAVAVYFARFIAYLRVFAAPLAGVLNMEWVEFFKYNTLGGLTWVALITTLAYTLGSALMPILNDGSWVILGSLGIWALYFWFKNRHKTHQSS